MIKDKTNKNISWIYGSFISRYQQNLVEKTEKY